MLPVIPNDALRRVHDATPSVGAGNVPSLGAVSGAGLQYPLGSRYRIPGTRSNRGLLVVESDGTLRQGLRPGDPDVASTDVVVEIIADSGDLEVVYVKNTTGSTIQRGSVLAMDSGGDGPYDVDLAAVGDEPGLVIGVALFDIPDDSACWIAAKGRVQVLCDGTTPVAAAREALIVGTADAGTAEGAATDATEDSFGISLEAGVVDTLFDAMIHCRG
jgi:hypothetical protein